MSGCINRRLNELLHGYCDCVGVKTEIKADELLNGTQITFTQGLGYGEDRVSFFMRLKKPSFVCQLIKTTKKESAGESFSFSISISILGTVESGT